MKFFLRTFFLSAIFGGIVCGAYFGWARGFPIVWSALIGGVIIGFASAILAVIRQNRISESSPVPTDEKILREGRASFDGISGWLYLTDTRLLFEGYPTDENSVEVTRLFNDDSMGEPSHRISIPILQITDWSASQRLGIESELMLVLADGTTREFATEELADWMDDLHIARQRYLDRPRSEEQKLFPGD